MIGEDLSAADSVVLYKNRRVNALAGAAFTTVILCLVMTVFYVVEDEFAKGILTLVLGRFLGYIDSVYNFEFGTTRGAKAQQDTINNLAAASPIAPSVVTKDEVDKAKPAPQSTKLPEPS